MECFAFVIIDFEKKIDYLLKGLLWKKTLILFPKNNEIIISSEIEPITY